MKKKVKQLKKEKQYDQGIDWTLAWIVVRATKFENHHEQCSYRTQQGGLICDCALWEGLVYLSSRIQHLEIRPLETYEKPNNNKKKSKRPVGKRK